jgi:CelD/BcsL family acetyltransferase involved in cellulose biosynthesis
MADVRTTHTGASAATTDLSVELITTEEALHAVRAEWDALWCRCPWATPFQSPEWQLAWWRHLGGGELRVVALRHGTRLVGLAPLFLYGPAASRRLALVGSGISDYEDVLLDPEYSSLGADAIMTRIAAWRGDFNVCTFPELRPESPLLHARVPPSLRARVAPSSVCPVLPLVSSFEQLEQGMGRTHRIKLRQGRKRLARAGEVALEMAGEHDVHALLELLVQLHERRWREQAEPGVLADPRVRAMHREAAPQLLARGCLRLFALRVHGGIIAVLYTMAWRGRLYCYLGGHDPEARYYSPGVTILRMVIEHAIADGMRQADFLRGREPYKYLWGATDSTNYELSLHPCESRGAS